MYVAISSSTLDALERALRELTDARRALSRAAGQVGELGQDLCDDAVARLRELRASGAQIANYEQGWELRRGALMARVEAIHAAERSLEAAIARVKSGGLDGEVVN
ncbi:MAG: hypothetical protein IT378_21050 [Sandaracinaceae bacterium]|nr:hypothetical protein [Sandaracinaceae bacterium]